MTEAKYTEIFNSYYKRLSLLAFKMVGEECCCDIVQDVFVNLWKSKDLTFENNYHIQAYLYRAVYNSCLNHIKHKKFSDKQLSEWGNNVNSFIEEEVIFLEDNVLIRIFNEIDRLPKRSREIFKLSYIEGMEVRRISELLGISENTIKTQKLRAKSSIKSRLNKKELINFIILFS